MRKQAARQALSDTKVAQWVWLLKCALVMCTNRMTPFCIADSETLQAFSDVSFFFANKQDTDGAVAHTVFATHGTPYYFGDGVDLPLSDEPYDSDDSDDSDDSGDSDDEDDSDDSGDSDDEDAPSSKRMRSDM